MHQHLSLYSLCRYRLNVEYLEWLTYVVHSAFLCILSGTDSGHHCSCLHSYSGCYSVGLEKEKGKKDFCFLFLQFKYMDCNSSQELICSDLKKKSNDSWIHIFMHKQADNTKRVFVCNFTVQCNCFLDIYFHSAPCLS